jgi:hypothetical protein
LKRSGNRILFTHTGSLRRPDDLLAMLQAKEAGQLGDLQPFHERVRALHPRADVHGPIVWKDFGAVERGIGNLKATVAALPRAPADVFMTAVSPGQARAFLREQVLPHLRGLPARAWRGHKARVRRNRRGRVRATGGLPRPRLGVEQHVRGWRLLLLDRGKLLLSRWRSDSYAA